MAEQATTRCPTCGEMTGATWRRLREVPDALPAYMLSHRRAGGRRCETVRGPWREEAADPNVCTSGGPGAILHAGSRSVRADERATA